MPSSPSFGSIEQKILEFVPLLSPLRPKGRGRPEILPATLLWSGLLLCVLAKSMHQTALWRLLHQHGLWEFPKIPVTAEAVRRRLIRSGSTVMQQWFADVTATLDTQYPPVLDLAPFASGVFAIDESTLDQVARTLPILRSVANGDDRLLPGKLQTVFNIRTQRFHHVQTTELPHQNEKVAARDLLSTIPPGSLVLTDLGYFAFKWFDDLTDGGYFYVSRQRRKISHETVHVLVDCNGIRDELIWLGAHRADRAKHLVRMITVPFKGDTYRYITNVCDPQLLSIRQVVELYARRWTVERAFATIKRDLGLHLLWSAHGEMILTQVYGVLIIAQIASALRGEIARRGGYDIFEVSMTLLLRELPWMLSRLAPGADLLDTLAALPLEKHGYIRPSSMTDFTIPDPGPYHPPPPDLPTVRAPRYANKINPPKRRKA